MKKPEYRMLTMRALHQAAAARISHIDKEFTASFEFLNKYDKSITVFGSSRLKDGYPYYEKAQSLCKRVAKDLGYSVITGGGPGIMEAANHGAFEVKGKSVGICIELPHEQKKNPYMTDNIDLYYLFIRKVALSFAAEAYVFFPGGFGTLDEFFEILTLVQTRKIQRVPLILFGSEFCKPLESFLRKNLLDIGTIDSADRNLYTITDSEDEAVEIIRNAPVRNGIPHKHRGDENE